MASEHVTVNPVAPVPKLRSSTTGFHSWTAKEVEKFKARHPIGTNARLALALLLYTGQRRSDVVRFGPAMVENEWLTFTQWKNRERHPVTLEIPVLPALRTIIDATPCDKDTFLVTDFGKAYIAGGFSFWFRKRCDEAGLPHCTAHGLRKAAASRLVELGATENQIMAITGHTTSREVARYTKGSAAEASRRKRVRPSQRIPRDCPTK